MSVDPEDGQVWVERPPHLFVFADYEATTGEQGVQSPIMICLEAEDEEETNTFYGSNCTEEMLDHLDGLTLDEN